MGVGVQPCVAVAMWHERRGVHVGLRPIDVIVHDEPGTRDEPAGEEAREDGHGQAWGRRHFGKRG